MTRWFAALLLSAAASTAQAQIDPSQSGLWFNPAQNGHGLEVTMLSPTSGTVTWFVYDGQGRPLHLGGLGTVDGNRLTVPVTHNRGMRFGSFVSSENRQDAWGTLVITFSGCNTAQLDWTSTYTLDGFAFGNGTMPLTRLTSVSSLPCGKRRGSGVYTGTLRPSSTGARVDFAAILDESGRVALIGNGQSIIYSGTYTTTGGTLAINGSAIAAVGFSFPGGTTTQTWTGSGPVTEGDFISGTYTSPIDNGSYSMQFTPVYRRGANLAALAGRYIGTTRSSVSITLTIAANGSVTGTDGSNCQYAGTFSVPNPTWNLYETQITITGCTAATGTFNGPSALQDANAFGDGRLLAVGAVNTTRSLPLFLTKQ